MILDNLLRYREAQSAAFGLSVAHKWSKGNFLNHRQNSWSVVPDVDFQAGWSPYGGYNDLPRFLRNRFAGIRDEVSDGSFEEVGIEPAQSQTLMMMLDGDASESCFTVVIRIARSMVSTMFLTAG